jgi:two-component system, chemotaxis family, protein-glutamate methylesterase/glutaminase
VTGLACPDCGGSLTARTEGQSGYMHFRCRIGHAYSIESLLAAKEDGLERCLWVAVTALEELLALGHDLQQLRAPGGAVCAPEDLNDRIARLQADAETVRRVVEANRPLLLLAVGGEPPAC